jgi:ankyrin repeat protein
MFMKEYFKSHFTKPANQPTNNNSHFILTIMDAFRAMKDEPHIQNSGRGEIAGWVICPLCPRKKKSQKKLCKGRGFRMHLERVHPHDPTHSSETLDEWAERMLKIMHETNSTAGPRAHPHASSHKSTNSKHGMAGTTVHAGLSAAAHGDVATVRRLVETDGWRWLSEGVDRHGSHAADWAAGANHVNVLMYLLNESKIDCKLVQSDRLVKPITHGTRGGRTVLHWAARNGAVDCVRFLLDHQQCRIHIPVDVPAGDGTTPLHLALYGAHLDVATLLVDAGADLMCANQWGCGPAHWAAMANRTSTIAVTNESKEQIKVIQPNHAVNICDESDKSPPPALAAIQWVAKRLCLTQRHGQTNTDDTKTDSDYNSMCLFTKLLKTQQNGGHTPLHKAALKGNQQCCEYILKVCESPTALAIPDAHGHLPSDVAAAAGFKQLAKILQENHV